MEGVAEGLWGLADYNEEKGEIKKAIKCLEAICQSQVSFLPIVEVKTRLRISTLLLNHFHNVTHAKSHLERSQLLLKSIPSCFELKCRTYSLLGQCYHLVGAIPSQKQILNKGLELTQSLTDRYIANLWYCNFTSQIANALIIEGDFQNSLVALENGYNSASEICYPELQMFFATSILHVHLMQWGDVSLVERSLVKCDEVWESFDENKRQQCFGLLFYYELLHVFYRISVCDYKNIAPHIDKLDAAMKSHIQRSKHLKDLTDELNTINQTISHPNINYHDRATLSDRCTQLQQLITDITGANPAMDVGKRGGDDKIEMAPFPVDGEWLPKSAVYALVDLTVVLFGRPKGLFKECGKRIQSGVQAIREELSNLGITDHTREVDLQHSAIWVAGVYLMLLMHFLENKVAIDLTRAEFLEAQQALVQMKDWYARFPTILQACESIIEMLRGQYAHSVACFDEATFHFSEAAKLTESKSVQAICQVYAAVSYICIGDAESSSQALDLIGPVYREMDSFNGVREKSGVLFAYGLLLMKQQNLQEARIRLASGLQLTHSYLGNLQLVSQYLTILGSLALALHDTSQARDILRSALTLAKKLGDIPTQTWVLSVMTALYQETGEKGHEIENFDYQRKKADEQQRRLVEAQASIHHNELVCKARIEVHELHLSDTKRDMSKSVMMNVNLDIPESIGLPSTSQPLHSSSRLLDFDSGRRGKRRI